ncbi:MAG: Gfo/Idh/MocA family oxidoreductase [Acidobacteria bacterium]|nr:Gfo/Idh/MocA family oxidoreductase [Acidobacteriota bacterium]
MQTRRQFLGTSAGVGLAVAANDNIQIALIGAGGMGMGDARYALQIPGVKLVAACDIYDGRLTRSKENWGPGLATTRDYREVLARKDVDAVIIATPDHWHARISIEALKAGKDVYCEKPMVQSLGEGHAVIDAQRQTGRILQVGSQYVSSAVYLKARDMIAAGAVGEVNMVEAWLDRNTAQGAWQYSIPPDASPATVDWDRFLGKAPKRPFEAIRLFRWRNYRDYGTGVAGDLFVHLLSGLHLVMNSIGPARIFATGGLRYWRDGRDVPDVMLAGLDYPKTAEHPEFTLSLRVNFASGLPRESFGFRFIGKEGTLTTSMGSLTLMKTPPEPEPGYSISTFPKAVQEQFLKEYRQKYPERPKGEAPPSTEERFAPPAGYDAHLEHHRNFYAALRSRKPFIEDALFGFRAAGPALACNTSYFEKRIVKWDPRGMKAG